MKWCWLWLAGTTLLSLGACHRNPVTALPPVASIPPGLVIPLSQVDVGASLLAETQNARFAISVHDAVAAADDVDQAMSFAVQLSDFAALVTLNSAQSELPADLQAADTYLRTVQGQFPAGQLPQDLPLLCAAASLDLARIGAIHGQTPELKTQLLTAQSALKAYSGPAHLAAAKALASTLGEVLASPQALTTLMPNRLNYWLSQVVQWAGSERWNIQSL